MGSLTTHCLSLPYLQIIPLPLLFEKKYRLQVARSYIRTIIGESSGMVGGQFLDDYSISNKSVAFNIAVFKSRNIANSFLKKSILFSDSFNKLAKEFDGTLKYIPLYSETNLVKSSYFKKYGLNSGMITSLYDAPIDTVISSVIPVKAGFAVIKILKVYFPTYTNVSNYKNKKNALLSRREVYVLQKKRGFLYDYVDYLESKANVKINKKALATFNF